MGESRNNPRSTQYKGPLPEFKVETDVVAGLAPSAAFAERLKLAADEAQRAGLPPVKFEGTYKDHDVVIYLRLHYIVPSRFTDKPPAASLPVVELFRKPLVEVQALARQTFERHDMAHVMPREEALVESK